MSEAQVPERAAVTFGGACPVLRVRSLAASLDHYVRVLGFSVDWEYAGAIASVSRGGCCLFLSEGDQGNPGSWVWIGVSDARALFAEYARAGARVRHPPTNYSWALEMQVEDPDGNVLRMGSDPDRGAPTGEWLDMHGIRWVPVPGGGWERAGEGERAADEDPAAAFLRAACVSMDGSAHASGTLEEAEAIRAAHPEVARSGIHAAAALGDDEAVRRLLAADPALATARGGPYGWDALTTLCFSRYLRLDAVRAEAFVRAAEALLDAGASAGTGFQADDHLPAPTFESALYGAAAVARHPELARLLLARGADPNDDEVPYHAPEGYDPRALRVLVESGKMTAQSLATMLHRKLDWADLDGVAWLLESGADPNAVSPWGKRALEHALERGSTLPFFERLLDHGADPRLPGRDGADAAARAAALGREDVAGLFRRRGLAGGG